MAIDRRIAQGTRSATILPMVPGCLLGELPGILNWAIEGWRRLHRRGHFVVPSSAADAVREIEDLSSPAAVFERERCVVGPGCRVFVDEMYDAWRWCEAEGRQAVTTRQTIGRDLAAAVAGVSHRRGTGGQPFYEGIARAERSGW